MLLASTSLLAFAPMAAADAADCVGNEIVCENQLPGTPKSEWDISGAGDESIQGFATQMSVDRGDRIDFKIKTDASAYTIQIFRLGYYQGDGARKVAEVTPSTSLPQIQPACATDPATEIFDCGTWGVSASWAVPSTAVSGVYIALLGRADLNHWSHIPFIVRNDESTSDLVFQTSDTTWQAYNTYGGSSMYQGQGNGRAYKLSYNRPFSTRAWQGGRDYLFSNEYPMIRFLESNGYDVSYISGLDTDARGDLLNNHKAFLSVGHDEYWTAQQRSNVESARDAGLNLAFFSGNDVYWKARWEPSQDGSSTPNRTLVCYKDTWAGTLLDPAGATSTWRDPRFGASEPENSLTGTQYMSNFTDLPITVSAEEGKFRLWRNTSLGSQPSGTSTELALHTIGYESNEDVDNGYRPAGLIRLSTTTGPAPEYLQDFGNTVAPGTTTHHLTLYRAASGALIFSAGTVQWAWGLDASHDGTVAPVSVQMQQATVNLLADMDVTTGALVTPGVVAASRTTDNDAPTSTITSPASGNAISQGSVVTVTGTASDSGGGQVAGVEISLDGGNRWHPADGRESFTYTGLLTGTGANAIQVRAIDDSGNIQGAPTVLDSPVDCPCTIFGAAEPSVPDAGDNTPITVGVKFTSAADGFITGIRFYKAAGNTGAHVGTLYQENGAVLATASFDAETPSGWQTASFDRSVPISAGATYVAAYRAPNGHYSADNQYFAYGGRTGGPITAPGGFGVTNGVYTMGNGKPDQSYRQTNYYVDVVYSANDPAPLSVVASTPLGGSSSVRPSTELSASFSRSVAEDSISWTLTDPAGHPIEGSTTYDPAVVRTTFIPAGALSPNTTYTATLLASADGVGAMGPASWSFTTAAADSEPGVCPCMLYNEGDQPDVPIADDPNAVELGTAFSSDIGGTITGIRFYKGPQNVGPHMVSLWTAAGVLVAQAHTTTESTSGWQTASFSAPVGVTAGQTYIASYRASVGGYSFTAGAFAAARQVGPLRTPANAGRYTYSSGAPLSASASSYFVEPILTATPEAAPEVSGLTPADGSTSVPTTTTIAATFNGPVQAGTGTFSVRDSAGAAVDGTIGSGPTDATLIFTPTGPLAEAAEYTVSIAGFTGSTGAAMAEPFTSAFRTSGGAACPCSLLSSTAIPTVSDSGDAGAITVGLRFRPVGDGKITGLRFYRAAANTGLHTGALYSEAGDKLASLTFTDADPGWQTASFDVPVTVAGGATYVAGVYMPNGHYSLAQEFFTSPVVNGPLTGLQGTYGYGSNAVPALSYRNSHYYVDVAFVSGTPEPPAVTTVSPDGSHLAQPGASASATFDRAIVEGTLQFSLNSSNGDVAGVVSYDGASRTATFRPSEALSADTTFTASVRASSVDGVAMSTPRSWQFTTVASSPTGEVHSLYTDLENPSIASYSDNGPVTVGVRFTPSRPGAITAVKFYTGPGNAGPFDVAVWASGSKERIGSGRFDGPAATGWVTVVLDAPVAVTEGNTYVASYRGSAGHYAFTGGGLTGGKTNRPLAVPANGGAYSYADGFPGATTGSEFFVDVIAVLEPVTSPSAPPEVSAQSPDGSFLVQPDAAVSATFDIDVDADTLSFTVRDSSGSPVAGSVAYDENSRTARFSPEQPFAFGASFTVSVDSQSEHGNAMETPVTWSFTTVAEPAQGTSYRLYPDSYVPATPAWNDNGPVTVGTRFTTAQAGWLTAVRFYAGPGNSAPWVVDVWDAAGTRLGGGTTTGVAAGWTTVLLDASVPIEAGVVYRASYRGASGHYALTPGGLADGRAEGPLAIPASGGVYSYPSGAPGNATSADFAVDVTVVTP